MKKFSRVNIIWQKAYAKSFSVEVSKNGKAWTDAHQTDDGRCGMNEIKFALIQACFACILCIKRGTQWDNVISELEIFQQAS